MTGQIVLASSSPTRAALLQNAGLSFDVAVPRLDEEAIRAALETDGSSPRDIADALAEMKARKISQKHADAMVIGCDQVLNLEGAPLGKSESPEDLIGILQAMRGKAHHLLSAVVIYEGGEPVWRHVGIAEMRVHNLSDAYIDSYVTRNWEAVRSCAGGYMLEGEGVRLFSKVSGDYFTVLGLPLLELLSYLRIRGMIDQ